MSASATPVGDGKGTRGGCMTGCLIAVAAVLVLLTVAGFIAAIVGGLHGR